MKKTYSKPSIMMVAIEDFCSNGLTEGSVQTSDGTQVDHFKVIEQEQSKSQYDWSNDSWGGN